MAEDWLAPPTEEELKDDDTSWLAPPTAEELGDEGLWPAMKNAAEEGLTFGFNDKINAGLKRGVDMLPGVKPNGKTYDDYLAEERASSKAHQQNYPNAHLATSVASSFLNPGNALIPGAGAVGKAVGRFAPGIAEMAPKLTSLATRYLGGAAGGAAAGGAVGAGKSENSPFSKDEEERDRFYTDVLKPAGAGALIGAGFPIAGDFVTKAVPAIAKTVGAGHLGAPKRNIERYLDRPDAVNAALPKHELPDAVKARVEALKNAVINESDASKKILKAPGAARYDAKKLYEADVESLINEIKGGAEKMLTPGEKKAIRYIQQKTAHIKTRADKENTVKVTKHPLYPDMPIESKPKAEKFTGARIKKTIQEIDRDIEAYYKQKVGYINLPEIAVLKRLRGIFRDRLERDNKAYAAVMGPLAKKAEVLENVRKHFNSDQGLMNTMERAAKDRAPFADKAFTDLDAYFPGTNSVDMMRDTLTRDAFNKGAVGPGGSAKVKTWGKVFGPIVDMQGPSVVKEALDLYLGTKKFFTLSPQVREYLERTMRAANAANMTPDINPAVLQYLTEKYLNEKGER